MRTLDVFAVRQLPKLTVVQTRFLSNQQVRGHQLQLCSNRSPNIHSPPQKDAGLLTLLAAGTQLSNLAECKRVGQWAGCRKDGAEGWSRHAAKLLVAQTQPVLGQGDSCLLSPPQTGSKDLQ